MSFYRFFTRLTYFAQRDLLTLEDKGINIVDDYPYLWSVGGTLIGATDIKRLYRLSQARAKIFEDENKS